VNTSRYLYESRWYNLRQDDITLPAGEDITYTLVEHPGWVMVVPVFDDGRVLMERVYRHTVGRTLLECPSGGLEGVEDPLHAARRELEEETGHRAESWDHLAHFVGSSGISDEEFDIYLARDLSADGIIEREATEEIELVFIDFDRLHEMAVGGEIEDAPTALALIYAWNKLHEEHAD
jgi:ADP-ribose pyrophosphatase